MLTLDDQFKTMRGERRIERYSLLPSQQIQAMMRTTTEICRLATARLESEIDVKTSTDKTKPVIWSLTLMHGTTVL
jgi:hypothetical protein